LESKMYADANTNSQQKASAMERFSVYVGILPVVEDIEEVVPVAMAEVDTKS